MANVIIETSDLLERIRAEIDERMSELLPQVEEHRRLLAAAASLEIDEGASTQQVKRSHTSTKRAAEPNKAPAKARRASTTRRRASVKLPTSGRPRAQRNATQQAIEAALEHGSHTLSELVLVTAIEARPIRAQLSRLQRSGVIGKVRREGKAAYSLLSAAAAASSGPKKGVSAK
jgi:hypothetical protein